MVGSVVVAPIMRKLYCLICPMTEMTTPKARNDLPTPPWRASADLPTNTTCWLRLYAEIAWPGTPLGWFRLVPTNRPEQGPPATSNSAHEIPDLGHFATLRFRDLARARHRPGLSAFRQKPVPGLSAPWPGATLAACWERMGSMAIANAKVDPHPS